MEKTIIRTPKGSGMSYSAMKKDLEDVSGDRWGVDDLNSFVLKRIESTFGKHFTIKVEKGVNYYGSYAKYLLSVIDDGKYMYMNVVVKKNNELYVEDVETQIKIEIEKIEKLFEKGTSDQLIKYIMGVTLQRYGKIMDDYDEGVFKIALDTKLVNLLKDEEFCSMSNNDFYDYCMDDLYDNFSLPYLEDMN